MNLRHSIKFVCLVSAILGLEACAPMHAAKVRKSKPVSIGLVGASVRVSENIDVGASYKGGDIETTKKMETTVASDNSTLERDYNYSSTSYVLPYVRYYPWKTSAFFIGAAAYQNTDRYNFKTINNGEIGLAEDATAEEYNIKTTHMVIPFGWAWIWESGFTFGLDLSIDYRVKGATEISNNSSINRADVENVVANIDENYGNTIGLSSASGTSIIGYSF